LVFGKEPSGGYVIDHDPLDNTLPNLREITHQQNSFNRVSSGNSIWKNVHKKLSGKYGVVVEIGGKQISGGCFVEELNAACHANLLIKDHHGEFANLNKDANGELCKPESYDV